MRSNRAFLVLCAAGALATAIAGAACSDLKSAGAPEDGGAGDGGALGDAAGGDAMGGDAMGGDAMGSDAMGDAAGDAGGVCTEATCATEIVLKGLYSPVALAVNATHVYFIEVGTTIPQGGGMGQLSRILKGASCADRSCFDVLDYDVLSGQLEGQYIYDTYLALGPFDACYTQSFNASPEHSIFCFSLTNGGKRVLDQASGDVVGLWVGGSAAAWAVASSSASARDGTVRSASLAGGDAGSLAVARPGPLSVTSDGARAYWTESGLDASAGAVNASLPDGGVLPIATGRAAPIAVQLSGGYVYWIDYGARTVMRAPADGTGSPEQIATTDETPFALAVDASGVYVAAAGAGQSALYGSVARAPLGPGGPTTVMLTNIHGAYALALDATDVYVASVGGGADGGQIARMKKTR